MSKIEEKKNKRIHENPGLYGYREGIGPEEIDQFEAELDKLYGPAETITLTKRFK